jgi:hypothetical protein
MKHHPKGIHFSDTVTADELDQWAADHEKAKAEFRDTHETFPEIAAKIDALLSLPRCKSCTESDNVALAHAVDAAGLSPSETSFARLRKEIFRDRCNHPEKWRKVELPDFMIPVGKLILRASEGGQYPLCDNLEFKIHGDTFRAWQPCIDRSGEIAWVKPLNMNLAYGVTYDGKFALCDTESLSDWIRSVISRHDTPEEMRAAFLIEQERRRTA